ncbi:MAG: methyltransferase domain-containing protein [Armatimonadetes bacterium]|nr:methyltransferase domain-containing protein [Armatimonadota bacterium]NIM23130.1 methyltransferase domain-containing protein [Armatimonadota bacterium]NIM66998.1 methyltransferase domain-containing protein [Armatimonadota bacterium]NIM75532.1 methyltransferase domain-containing protein [Armatimonadota bacterium]NIN05187.1 methyltransferase domain-containing protein [Armatimonadota bacterium]
MPACLSQLVNPVTERERLEQAAGCYDSRRGLSYRLVRSGADIVLAHAHGPRLLEMGCANGVMTEVFAVHFPEVVVVEGTAAYAEAARAILGDAGQVHCSLFEEFEPDKPFNDIVMAGMLEHVADPVGLLHRAAGWLAAGGSIHAIVPHAMSLHRRVGVAMGLLTRSEELHSGDIAIGHRRIYTWDSVRSHIEESGLRIVAKEGNFLKPLSNQQMAKWPEDLLEAFQVLGRELPDLCAEIYLQCRPAESD